MVTQLKSFQRQPDGHMAVGTSQTKGTSLTFEGIHCALLTQLSQRSFDEMSRQLTISPSPVLEPVAFRNIPRLGSFGSNNNELPPMERRRVPHPHNTPQEILRASEGMADERSLSRRPSLRREVAQTLIDLTSDPEDSQPIARNRGRSHSQRPPQLGRSDAQALGSIIDLTEDNDIEITSSRQITPVPNHAVHYRRHRAQEAQRPPQLPRIAELQPPRQARGPLDFGFPFGGGAGHVAMTMFRHMPAAVRNLAFGLDGMEHLQAFENMQPMPDIMDYRRDAFVAERKPDHVAPPPAKAGFTRSPTDDDVVVCPSCDEELVHDEDEEEKDEEPAAKRGGKTASRKEREEHPFWVVKECGHVRYLPFFCGIC